MTSERVRAHLTGPLDMFDAHARLQGWRGATQAAGVGDLDYGEGDFSAESGFALTRQVMDAAHPPTAIFAANDQMALGAIAALVRNGVHVPTHVSIVGFDDMAGAGFLTPALTTVRQDFAARDSTAPMRGAGADS